MSNRTPSMNTVHPSVDPRGGIYQAEIDRIKNKIKLGDRISVTTMKGYVNINPDSTKPGIAQDSQRLSDGQKLRIRQRYEKCVHAKKYPDGRYRV